MKGVARMKIRPLLWLVCWCALTPGAAQAYYAPLVFLPLDPVAGQPVSVRLGFAICDMLVVAGPQDRQVVVEGSVLKLTVRGVEAPDFDFCIYPDSGYADFDVGPLSPGHYAVQVYRSMLFDPTQIQLVRTGFLTVGQAPAVPVPVRDPIALLVGSLAVALSGSACVARRRRCSNAISRWGL